MDLYALLAAEQKSVPELSWWQGVDLVGGAALVPNGFGTAPGKRGVRLTATPAARHEHRPQLGESPAMTPTARTLQLLRREGWEPPLLGLAHDAGPPRMFFHLV